MNISPELLTGHISKVLTLLFKQKLEVIDQIGILLLILLMLMNTGQRKVGGVVSVQNVRVVHCSGGGGPL